jgi:hypothetical protein
LDQKIENLEGEIAESNSQPKKSDPTDAARNARDLRKMTKRLATLEVQQNILLSQKSRLLDMMKKNSGRGAISFY